MTRQLPMFKGYTVDARLGEFRKIAPGKTPVFIPFESRRGQRLMTQLLQEKGSAFLAPTEVK